MQKRQTKTCKFILENNYFQRFFIIKPSTMNIFWLLPKGWIIAVTNIHFRIVVVLQYTAQFSPLCTDNTAHIHCIAIYWTYTLYCNILHIYNYTLYCNILHNLCRCRIAKIPKEVEQLWQGVQNTLLRVNYLSPINWDN